MRGTPPAEGGVEALEASEYFYRFVRALKRGLEEPMLAAELARHARARACREFSLDTCCQGYLGLYRELVPSPMAEGMSSCAAS